MGLTQVETTHTCSPFDGARGILSCWLSPDFGFRPACVTHSAPAPIIFVSDSFCSPPPLLFLTLGNLLISFSPSFRWLACRRLSKDNEFETSLVCPHAGSALLHTFSQAASQKGRTTSVASSVFCHIFSERQKKKKKSWSPACQGMWERPSSS